MGVDIGNLIVKKEAKFEQFQSKKIAFDSNNMLYQFLSNIRGQDGSPLTCPNGKITSHLTGLFYRTANLIDREIKPAFVFDGKPSKLKMQTLKKRNETRTSAKKKHEIAKKTGDLESAKKYASMSSKLTKEMVEESKELLEYLGFPVVQAPSEGESQAAQLAFENEVSYVSSQDYDSLLFGTPNLIRNLAFSGKRKLPGRNIYVDISIETINLEETLAHMGINRQKLIWLSILIGTDFNEKLEGIGPKTAIKLVKKYDNFEDIIKDTGKKANFDYKEIEQIFLDPKVEKGKKIEFGSPNKEKVLSFLCDKRNFSEERVKSTLNRIENGLLRKGTQSRLGQWG